MHICLNVDEILRLIACELVASRGNATAVALACCRKSFEDPALDALWETQNQLLPLLKSFPGDIWNEGRCTSFKRLPTTAEWARFRKYARRMRELQEFRLGSKALPVEALSTLESCSINEPLIPNLKTLYLSRVPRLFIQFIPFFLSPGVTSIYLSFESDCPKAMVASLVSSLPKLCPNLQKITLYFLPTDPMITAAVSGMVLAINRNALQEFHVDSPLPKEAVKVVFKLPGLCKLSVVTERGTPLPSASLPNLTSLTITCDGKDDLPQLFHGVELGKLESVTFYPRSEEIGDFLGTFEKVASSSVRNTLSKFYISTSFSWNPNFLSLLSLTQLVNLTIQFPCDGGCSSRVDDDMIIDLSRAMPKLTSLSLGDIPCEESTVGVTANGLVALALHCPGLWYLCIHFQVASLIAPSASLGIGPNTETIGSWTDCDLTEISVGEIAVPEESVLMVAQTLLRIFPQITSISSVGEEWKRVEDAIEDLRLSESPTQDE